ncbi:Protein phosphatase 1 regulatory subunit 14B [Caenorhabditis elegans]|uniref:Protein phosphatase 1 regulatory subunit 14B n=1 Tax=Caenorhabditis elegans TaxID=6239 RepID=Q7YX00_CAEEL|nr:Protein phosphatase 1 regulatory subunit 14B [Caenorhabditis elegans]CAE17849.1 Protein phosphatase 1 regulatory subunit 14B [Caenorhabditis elegans]|eukprot:NP_001023978.1 Uncharacterized protein CELE_F55C10.5 [Caenorhabditis elegans]
MPFGEKHARFGDSKSRMEDRSRVLTMKYGKHQMALIRKRMKVENWIETEVTKLFNGNETNNVDIDLDVIQDIEDVTGKRKFAFEQLQKAHCPCSMDKIIMFLDELIIQLNTL